MRCRPCHERSRLNRHWVAGCYERRPGVGWLAASLPSANRLRVGKLAMARPRGDALRGMDSVNKPTTIVLAAALMVIASAVFAAGDAVLRSQ
jgi:hypothetical protein